MHFEFPLTRILIKSRGKSRGHATVNQGVNKTIEVPPRPTIPFITSTEGDQLRAAFKNSTVDSPRAPSRLGGGASESVSGWGTGIPHNPYCRPSTPREGLQHAGTSGIVRFGGAHGAQVYEPA